MGKYSNGIETKQRILDICRKFFYEKGYDNTTFKDISTALDINQSAIHYHFGTKEHILQEIYDSTIRKNNELVEFYSDRATGELAKMFFDIELYMYKIWNDPNYRRFYLNATSAWDSEEFIGGSKYTYRYFVEDSFTIDDMDKYGSEIFKRIALAGFDQAVLRFVNNNIDRIDYKKTLEANMWMYKKILNIPDDEYKNARAELQLMEDRCKWDELDTTLSI